MYSVIFTLLIDIATTYSRNFLLVCNLKAFNFLFGLYTVVMICMHIYMCACVCVSTLQRNFISAILFFFSTHFMFLPLLYTLSVVILILDLLSWLSELSYTYKL